MPNDDITDTKLSKGNLAWLFVDIMLLIAVIALSVVLLIFSIYYTKTYSRSHSIGFYHLQENQSVEEALSAPIYSVELPEQERDKTVYKCSGTLISKSIILTSSPCAKDVKFIVFNGSDYQVEKIYTTKMQDVQFKNFTVINRKDLQLSLLKMSCDMKAYGMTVMKLPTLTESVIHSGTGSLLYVKNGEMQVKTISFIHPFYCHLVYRKHGHIMDYNFMICAVSAADGNQTRSKSVSQICLKKAIGGAIVQKEVLFGVLTLTLINSCGEPQNPFVFINVIPFLQWFDANNINYS